MEDDTVATVNAATLPGSTPSAAASSSFSGERYELGDVLGRGGMGEVRIARDTRVDREVAVKLLRPEQRDPDTVARFFREARVQGALEHPAVVPIHDLGIDATGNPYFVMKRLAGVTLAEVLADPAVRARWPRPKLLARLVDVCLALELAHTRGIVHRDLKPANLMLGDYGEAYVLDWGIARVLGSDPDTLRTVARAEPGETRAGDLLGTPGYLAPEQARGEPVDHRADVFSLGCVLFEVLAGEPAFPRGLAGLSAVLEGGACRPRERVPDADVPIELDALCARATAPDRTGRPTARELADGIQAYLDGDRDLERRRALAAELAHRALAIELVGDDARAVAIREAGRALALDPENPDAQLALARLAIQAPREIPADALVAADAARSRMRQDVLRWGARAYLGAVIVLASTFAFPVHTRWPIVVADALAIVTWLIARGIARRPLPIRSRWFLLLLASNALLIGALGLMFGPLLIMPLFMIGSLAAYLEQPSGYPPWVIVVSHAAPLVALVALEQLGVTPPTFHVEDGALVLVAPVLDLTPVVAALIYAIALASQFANTAIAALAARSAQARTQNLVHAQKWHLDQLLPKR